MLFIYGLKSNQRLDQLEQDMSTITAGDFTVELDISKDMYKYYLRQHYEFKGKDLEEEDGGGEKYSSALYLKKHLSEEISRILTDALNHRTSNAHKAEESSKSGFVAKNITKKTAKKPKTKAIGAQRDSVVVKDVQFAYKNYEVINLLKTRGYAITYCDWKKVEECDQKLTQLVQDGDKFDSLTRPVCAFITFESDDGYIEALSYSKKLNWSLTSDKDPVMDGFKRE